MKPPVLRRLLALVLLPLVLALSSCARLQESVDIRSEQDIRVHLNLGITKSAAASARINQQTICEQFKSNNVVPSGATVTRYEDAEYIGCTIDFSAILSQLHNDVVTHHNGLWTFTLRPDAKNIKGVPASLNAGDFSDFNVSVTFPGTVTQHNGGSTVAGRTVTWTHASDWMSADGLHAEAKDAPDLSAFVAIGLGVLVFAGAAVTVAWLVRRAKRAEAAMQTFVDEGFERHQHSSGDAEEIRRYYEDPDRYRAITGTWAPAYRPQDQAAQDATARPPFPPSGASAYPPEQSWPSRHDGAL